MSDIYGALFGYGNIGKGVKDMIDESSNHVLKYIFDRPQCKEALGDLYCDDIDKIMNDVSINYIIECLGGDDLAYPVIIKALSHGKNVITSNKETVSKHVIEYERLAQQNNVSFKYEASVGGGMPILETIRRVSSYDEITKFMGILNGTTNFILDKVFNEDMYFEDAVKEAQRLGFAERDPSADINGTDIMRKGIILKYLITGQLDKPEDCIRYGIEGLDRRMINAIKDMNMTLKLVVTFSGNKILIMPRIISWDNPLCFVRNEFNSLVIEAKHNGRLQFIGKGAGRYPTASAVIQDLDSLQRKNYRFTEKEDELVVKENMDFSYLIREGERIYISESFDPTVRYDFIARIEDKHNEIM